MQSQFTNNEFETTDFGYDCTPVETDSVEAYSRQVKNVTTGGFRYYVSHVTSGVEANRMRNDTSQFQPHTENVEVSHSGRMMYELKEVSKEAFVLYHDFLVSGNINCLRNAERVAR